MPVQNWLELSASTTRFGFDVAPPGKQRLLRIQSDLFGSAASGYYAFGLGGILGNRESRRKRSSLAGQARQHVVVERSETNEPEDGTNEDAKRLPEIVPDSDYGLCECAGRDFG